MPACCVCFVYSALGVQAPTFLLFKTFRAELRFSRSVTRNRIRLHANEFNNNNNNNSNTIATTITITSAAAIVRVACAALRTYRVPTVSAVCYCCFRQRIVLLLPLLEQSCFYAVKSVKTTLRIVFQRTQRFEEYDQTLSKHHGRMLEKRVIFFKFEKRTVK